MHFALEMAFDVVSLILERQTPMDSSIFSPLGMVSILALLL